MRGFFLDLLRLVGPVSSRRTAACGPACTVVWEGRAGDCSPFSDQEAESARFGTPDVKTNATLLQIVLVPILRCLFLKTEL